MTKAQILAEIAALSHVVKVGTPKQIYSMDEVTLYDVPVWYQTATGVNGVTSQVYVHKEGSAQESAYYGNNKPQQYAPAVKSQFQQDVEAQIAAAVASTSHPAIKGFITEVNDANKFAKVTAYQLDANNKVIQVNYFAYRDNANALQFTLMA